MSGKDDFLFPVRSVFMQTCVFFSSLLAFLVTACDNDPPPHFKFNEHYIVVDYSENGLCPSPIQISYQGVILDFQERYDCGTVGPIPCPTFLMASNHSICVDQWSNCRYINRGFLLTNYCRLLIDIDAVKANYSISNIERRAQVTNQPTEPFHLEMQFRNLDTNAFATIDATFLPSTFDLFPKCFVDGQYEESEYGKLYDCVESMTPHAILELTE